MKKVDYKSLSKLFEKTEKSKFTTFPTTLETYPWYKSILIFIIAAIISLAISFVVMSIIKADPTKDCIVRLIYASIPMIALIPGIYIGTKLLYKIPFSTQIAPVRKWDWGIYIKAFIIVLIVYGLFVLVPVLTSGVTITDNLQLCENLNATLKKNIKGMNLINSSHNNENINEGIDIHVTVSPTVFPPNMPKLFKSNPKETEYNMYPIKRAIARTTSRREGF